MSEEEPHEVHPVGPFEQALIAIDGAVNALVMARLLIQNSMEGHQPPEPERPASDGGCRHSWQEMPDGSRLCVRCGDAE